MIKQTVTYTDYNGVSRTEDFYFNLSESELMEMELTSDGAFTKNIERIAESKDQKAIFKAFKSLILDSYGEKSEDGRLFIKTDEDGRRLSDFFVQTEAFNSLFLDLMLDKTGDKIINFFSGIVGKNLKDKFDEVMSSELNEENNNVQKAIEEVK